ncbi:RIP metalloprotease RseP [Alkaliphilus crotonatoxidans]
MGTAIAAIIVFSMLVFFHELGHFAIAKLVGIKVHEFAIGMGPKLFAFSGSETDYSVRAFPIGGYVKMEGEDEKSEDARSFNKKSVPARMAVIVAGPIMNFILGLLLFTLLFYMTGSPVTTIDQIIPDSPAEMVEIMPGDQILKINDEQIGTWSELEVAIGNSGGAPLEVVLERDSQIMTKTITPMRDEESGKIMIGIVPKMESSLKGAIQNSFHNFSMIVTEIMEFLRRLVTRQASSSEVAGPIGIISLVGEATRAGWLNVVFLAALISVNLGLMNLLPIPALDGSRLLFLLVELLRGKPVDPDREGMIHMIGFSILIALMVFVTYQDIVRLFN